MCLVFVFVNHQWLHQKSKIISVTFNSSVYSTPSRERIYRLLIRSLGRNQRESIDLVVVIIIIIIIIIIVNHYQQIHQYIIKMSNRNRENAQVSCCDKV